MEENVYHLLLCLLIMMNGVEQNSLKPILFPSCFFLNVDLRRLEAQRFSNWGVWGILLDMMPLVPV